MSDGSIYDKLTEHQKEEEWYWQNLAQELHRWAEIFNRTFDLKVSRISLRIENLGKDRYGHFVDGHNAFGLLGEIAMNAQYLNRDFWQILGTLLHELLHDWQFEHGKPGKGNYHNVEFRSKAETLGLIIDGRGVTEYSSDSPFTRLLTEHGIDVPDPPVPPVEVVVKGKSKLKKWSCSCTNVRAAVELRAKCLRCGKRFTLQE